MTTSYGVIKCAKYKTHSIEVYTSLDDSIPTIKLFAERDTSLSKETIGTKIILDQFNIDDFLGAIQCALKEKNIFSNYLNPEGRLHNE